MTHRFVAAVIAALLLAGCAGGSHGNAVLPNASTTASSRQVSFEIVVPRSSTTSATARAPQFVSPNTQSLTYNFGWIVAGAAQSFASGTVNVSTCPISGSGAVCTLSVTIPAKPSNASSGMALAVGGWSGPNGTGTLLEGQNSAGFGPFAVTYCGTPAQAVGAVTACTFTLGGIVATATIYQTAPLVAGTPATMTMAGTFLDGTGAQIVGSDCLAAGNATTSGPIAYVALGTPAGLTVQSGSPSCMASNLAAGSQSQGINQPGAQVTYAYAGPATIPPITFEPETTFMAPPGYVQYTPLVVPSPAVTISGAPATLVVTPPATFTGSVTLAVSHCLLADVLVPSDGSTATNVPALPLISASPANLTSTLGSPVTFTVSSTGAAGVCTLTSSADGSTYGAVVAW